MIVGSGEGPSGDGDDKVPSDVADALQHDRRREIIKQLSEESGELSLVTLASQIAADVDSTLPNVVLELHKLQIPTLTDCGLIEYDDDTGTVTLTAEPEVIEAALDNTDNRDT